jgi:cell division initiation protein
MSYTPVELRHVKVARSLFGYNRATVEQLIEEVAQSFEATWRERGELADKVEALEKQVTELRGREHLLTQTLVAAEQAASDVREKARREAETIVQEAHNEARAIGRNAQSERERLFVESKRIEGMLRGALGMIESETAPAPAPVPVPVPKVVEEPEPAADAEPVAPVDEAASEPVVEALPVISKPEPELDPEYGWAREDTREFEPISLEEEPVLDDDHDDEEPHQVSEPPVLERIPGAASRDFDWGE